MQPNPRIRNKQEWISFLGSEPPKTMMDLQALRLACYKQIEETRGRPLLVYYVRFIPAVEGSQGLINIDLSDIDGFTDLVNSIKGIDEIDILIHSPGGYPDATERIVEILRNKFKAVHFLIPHSAYSAATMLALSGNTVTLHPSATMGPIDPQINGIPARSIKRGFENVKEKVKNEGPESLPAYIPLIEKYSIDLLEQCEDALILSKKLVTNWLKGYMLKGEKDIDDNKIEEIVTYFSDYDEHLTHSRPLFLAKINKYNLKIKEAEPELAELLWEAHLLIDGFFEATTFVKLFENSFGISWGRQAPVMGLQSFPK